MKILFATDGEKQSLAAGAMLRRFNLGASDEVHIVCVIDMSLPIETATTSRAPDASELETAARVRADRILTETKEALTEPLAAGTRISTTALSGSPGRRIVEAAEETGADLIIVGSHGHSRWERLVLGSVSDFVVRHAHCSVMLIRENSK